MSAEQAAQHLKDNINALKGVLNSLDELGEPLGKAAILVQTALLTGRKVLACGNGGSSADAAHLTGELAGRYVIDRRGYCAIDLTANNSLLTALINDYPPADVYARQVEALGSEGDVLVALTTSGNSENVVKAIKMAKSRGLKTIAFLGRTGGTCKGLADVELIVRAEVTARIQEAHLLLYHTLCEAIDQALAEKSINRS